MSCYLKWRTCKLKIYYPMICVQMVFPALVFLGLKNNDCCGCCGNESCGKRFAVRNHTLWKLWNMMPCVYFHVHSNMKTLLICLLFSSRCLAPLSSQRSEFWALVILLLCLVWPSITDQNVSLMNLMSHILLRMGMCLLLTK